MATGNARGISGLGCALGAIAAVFIAGILAVTVVTLLNFGALTNLAERQARQATLLAEVANLELQTLAWANRVSAAVAFDRPQDLTGQTDAEGSSFGAWYYGDSKTDAVRLVPTIADSLEQVKAPYESLYTTAGAIRDALEAGNTEQARSLYANDFLPTIAQVAATFQDMNMLLAARAEGERNLVDQLAGSKAKLVTTAILAAAIGLFAVLVIAFLLPKVLHPRAQRDIQGG